MCCLELNRSLCVSGEGDKPEDCITVGRYFVCGAIAPCETVPPYSGCF